MAITAKYRARWARKLGCAYENSACSWSPSCWHSRVPALAATTPTGKSAAQIRAYYSSGDWNRAVKKQADKAKAYIAKRTKGKRAAKKPALVLDIDETSLNNYPCLDREGRPSLRRRVERPAA